MKPVSLNLRSVAMAAVDVVPFDVQHARQIGPLKPES